MADRPEKQETNGDVPRVGFIGAGKMATALARGLIASGFRRREDVVACDVIPAVAEAFNKTTCGGSVANVDAVLAVAEVIILAVKPQQMTEVLETIRPLLGTRHLVVSIAAGVPLGRMQELLGKNARIIRVMPNTPCLVGSGASAFALGEAATRADGDLVEKMLSTVGIAIEVPEKLLDAVTGLSGSGPAYVYQIIEALSDGGVRVGLPRPVATRLAAQTVLGSAQMVLETGEHPGALKDAVTSPGGTTIAGIHALERGGIRGILMEAVVAATNRSIELGK